jgi:hypothetical protein
MMRPVYRFLDTVIFAIGCICKKRGATPEMGKSNESGDSVGQFFARQRDDGENNLKLTIHSRADDSGRDGPILTE